jgi:hypothetical protein
MLLGMKESYSMSQGLGDVRKAATERKQDRFTVLLPHLTYCRSAAGQFIRVTAASPGGSLRQDADQQPMPYRFRADVNEPPHHSVYWIGQSEEV